MYDVFFLVPLDASSIHLGLPKMHSEDTYMGLNGYGRETSQQEQQNLIDKCVFYDSTVLFYTPPS